MPTCRECNKLFSTQFNLNKHCRRVHRVGHKFSFKCLDCVCTFKHNSDLIMHLKVDHLKEIQEESVKFQYMEEFKSWKSEIEKKERCNYVAINGRETLSSGDQIQHFICNRSGNLKASVEANKRKRNFISQGSRTISHSYSCISRLTLTKTGQEYLVHRIITHYGHLMDIKPLGIDRFDRQKIALKLVDGISSTRVLDNVRSTINANPKRRALMTKKDINNIRKSFNIHLQEGAKHEEDVINVDGKHVESLDKGLHATLKYAGDKVVDRIIKNTKGKINIRQEHFKRHRCAFLSSFVSNQKGDFSWNVLNGNMEFLIKKTSDRKCCNIDCQICQICVHQFKCSCSDYTMNSFICRHIHFIAFNNGHNEEKINYTVVSYSDGDCVDSLTATNSTNTSNKN